jgi:hypothetical protein
MPMPMPIPIPMPSPVPTPAQHLFQIAYSAESRAQITPGWQVLDNQANPRPDWYEYWPIRHYLLHTPLDESAFYGFFSPKFSAKTNLSLDQVQHFVAQHAAHADVLLFSPQPDMGAFFLNVFEQGEAFDSGLIDAFSAFLQHIGRPVALRSLVMDSRQVVFSNYFIARPAFWREWLAVNEALFAICEGHDTTATAALRAGLTQPTSYATGGKPADRKVFLQERVASLLLATQPQWRSRAHDPFGMGWSLSRFRQHPTEAFISDALKLAWRVQPYPEYLQAFATLRDRFSKGQLPVASG